QLLWCPESGQAWCMAECAAHVALTNRAYLENMKPVLSSAPAQIGGDEYLRIGGWLSALLLKSVSPGAPRKMTAPKKIRPLRAVPEAAFEELEATHDEILVLLQTKPSPGFNRLRFQNPFVPLIRFTVASGFLIMAAHAERHLLQAQRVSAISRFPAVAV